MTHQSSRRKFLGLTAGAAATALVAPDNRAAAAPRRPRAGRFEGSVCFFSKHLPQLRPGELGRVVKEAGFDGVDLTVRPGGHVLPERAAQDLAPALRGIRAHDVSVPMITTGLTTAEGGHARAILAAAGREKVAFFKTGYYDYAFTDVRREVASVAAKVRALAELGREHTIALGFHNHAGNVGASTWDAASIIEPLDPAWAGYYFDPRHAIVEGGEAGWKLAAHLAAPRLKMVAVKDCFWEKRADGRWHARNCPLGDGMVDWPVFWSIVAGAGFRGPISLHLEYDIAVASPASLVDATLEAAIRDLATLRRHLDDAYAGRPQAAGPRDGFYQQAASGTL
jgi:L-ribulose-5-phosphate 3-epimerase